MQQGHVKLDGDRNKWRLALGATVVATTTSTGEPAIVCSGGSGSGFAALDPHLLVPSGENFKAERLRQADSTAFTRHQDIKEAERSLAMFDTCNNGKVLVKWGGCGKRGVEGDGQPCNTNYVRTVQLAGDDEVHFQVTPYMTRARSMAK